VPEPLEAPVLRGGTVTLRPWRAADAPALAGVCGDPDVCRFSTVPWVYTLAAAIAWVDRQGAKLAAGSGLSLAVTGPADDQVVGNVSLNGLGRWGRPSLGYWLVPAPAGGGWPWRRPGW
jgi:ribosomal-protein-alanine N-acetyltransferase